MARTNGWVVLGVALLAGCAAQEAVRETSTNEDRPPPPTAEEQHATMGPPQTVAQWAVGAMLFDRLGDFHRPVTTNSAEAQKYFDQGMRLLWAFNHDESTRSFAKAAQLDPACGLCYWGVALTVGPNYNLPMMAEPRAKVAFEATQLAQKNAAGAKPVEQALIGALGKRYPNAQPLDPSNEGPVLTAYANAMREVAKQFPADTDVQVLFAESMMNLNAWKLWTPDGKPAPGTPEIQATLEKALKANPGHPGANHYYVHTMEASQHPEKALAAAEKLNGMMPGAGHLQHMPAHIMQRVGRYEDAAQANRAGALADSMYLAQTQPPDYYGMYVAHNYQFLAYSAAMEGRKAEALDAARKTLEIMPDPMLAMMPGFDWCVSLTYPVMLRFGMWDELIAEPEPANPALQARRASWLYTRAVAYASKGRLDEAKSAIAQLDALAAAMPADYGACFNTGKDVTAIAALIAKASVASVEHRSADAVAALREAVAREDKLNYDEPADWFFPVRHLLGAQLLRDGKPKEAEAVYKADLARNPGNGWALYGLAQALRDQKKTAEAAKVDKRFQEAWQHADIKLTASLVP